MGGGPADIGGSWTPNLTPEVKAATKFFIDQFNTVELGGLAQLQARQIPNAYIADTPEVAAAKEAFLKAFKDARWGSSQRLPRSTTTFRQVRFPAPSSTTR